MATSVSDFLRSLAQGALPAAVKTVEIRSALAPPVVIDIASATTTSTSPSPIVTAAKPTVILSGGQLGTQVIAPYGQVDPNAWKVNLALLGGAAAIFGAAVVMLIYKVGVFSGRR